ncbi:unnamed protein product, partial [Polarella glacialis]
HDDLDESLEVYRTLASDELQVELLPAPGGRKRALEPDAQAKAEEVAAAAFSDEDGVDVVLCDQGPRSGGMSYYLGRQWQHPASRGADG